MDDDIKQILDQALLHQGAEVHFNNSKGAYHWRARANKHRITLRKKNKESKYDLLMLSLEGNKVVITIKDLPVKITTLTGKEIVLQQDAVIEFEQFLNEE